MIKLKVRKFENSLGIVLPDEVVNRLQISAGQTLFLTEAPDGCYLLTCQDHQKMAKATDIINRYDNTLATLAD